MIKTKFPGVQMSLPREPVGGDFVVELRYPDGGMATDYWPRHGGWVEGEHRSYANPVPWSTVVQQALDRDLEIYACRKAAA